MPKNDNGDASPLRRSRVVELDEVDRIFQALPPLGSARYLEILRSASARELPAPVLVRAYRQLLGTRAGELTLARLLSTDAKYGYTRPLRRMAEKLVDSIRDWFDEKYLIEHAMGFIAEALGGSQGEGADRAWHNFLWQRMIDAVRDLNGRTEARRDPLHVLPTVDAETGEIRDPLDDVEATDAPWNGTLGSDFQEWFHDFIRRTLPSVIEDRMVLEVALDQFGPDPSPISSDGKSHRQSLTERLGIDRFKIRRCRDVARIKLLRALEEQNERDVDVSWLKYAIIGTDDGGQRNAHPPPRSVRSARR